MDLPKTIASSPAQGWANLSGGNHAPFSDQLLEKARVNVDTALKELESRLSGLSAAEVEARIKRDGLNEIGREKRPSPLRRLWDNVKNPLVILLIALGVVSFPTGDQRATIVIFVMVLLGVVLRYFQEMRADNAVEKLKAMVNTTATVVCNNVDTETY